MGQGSFNLNCVYKNKSVLEIFYAKSFMKTKLKNLYRFLLYLNLDLLLQFVVAKKKIGFWTQNSVPKFRSPSFDPQISIPKFRYPNFGPQISIPKFRTTIFYRIFSPISCKILALEFFKAQYKIFVEIFVLFHVWKNLNYNIYKFCYQYICYIFFSL